jgi:transposase-like protein
MKGHGTKFESKKEAVIAALLTQKNHEEAARTIGISLKTLKRWMRLPEFIEAWRRARWEVVEQACARAQQNTGVATSVLLKLMADPATPSSSRIRAVLGIFDIARTALDLEVETRVAALERAAEESASYKR